MKYMKRYKGSDKNAEEKYRSRLSFAYSLGLGQGPMAHGRQFKIFAAEQIGAGEEKNEDADAREEKKRQRDEINQDREQSRFQAFDERLHQWRGAARRPGGGRRGGPLSRGVGARQNTAPNPDPPHPKHPNPHRHA